VSSGTALAVAITAVAGLAGSVQIAIMGRLGERIGTLEALAFATLVTALLALAMLVAVRHGLGGYADAVRQPAWLWLGGLMGLAVVFAITFAAPRIGTAATIGVVIAGQLAMGAVIDRYGLFGLERIALTRERAIGLLLLAAGAALSLKR
jgi:bacterial/archaeal transporter family-2 protein